MSVARYRREKSIHVTTLALASLVTLTACDSPTPAVTPAHREPWAKRQCASPAPTFVPGQTGGSELGSLDLCGVTRATLSPSGELPDVAPARSRAAAILAGLSQAEKLTLVQGRSGSYVGNIGAVSGVPALTLQDGPAGVARFTDVTAFPAPIALRPA